MSEMKRLDAIIIGAGAAGLAAAMELVKAGRRIAILEARDRIGGRIHTGHDPAWPLPIERGAEFIHGKPRQTFDILSRAAIGAYDVVDTHWRQTNGRLIRQGNFWSKIEDVFERIDRHRGADLSFQQFMRTT